MQRCQTSPDRECTSLEDIHNLCLPGAGGANSPYVAPRNRAALDLCPSPAREFGRLSCGSMDSQYQARSGVKSETFRVASAAPVARDIAAI